MALKLRSVLQNPFSFLFTRSTRDDRVAAYVIRQHRRGRTLADILEDPYIRNRLTPQQSSRLLERHDIIHAVGEDIIRDARGSL